MQEKKYILNNKVRQILDEIVQVNLSPTENTSLIPECWFTLVDWTSCCLQMIDLTLKDITDTVSIFAYRSRVHAYRIRESSVRENALCCRLKVVELVQISAHFQQGRLKALKLNLTLTPNDI